MEDDESRVFEEIYLNQNNILSFGYNYFGQLGLGDNTYSRSKPTHINYMTAKYVSCGNNYTVLIDMNNNVWVFGSNFYGELGLGDNINRTVDIPIKINDIKAKSISCGSSHTLLIDMNIIYLCWNIYIFVISIITKS